MSDTPRFAVMGHPIAHSLSPHIHQLFAEQMGLSLHYDKIDVPPACFEQYVTDFFNHPEGKGLNITLPFKERAFALAKVQSARALHAGAANTLWMDKGVLHADNTDGVGLIRDLSRYTDLNNKRVVLLGAGGAARSVLGELLNAHPATLILSNRAVEKAHALKVMFPSLITCPFEALTASYDIIINATAASLQDQTLPLPKTILVNHPFCYDLSYNINQMTPFVQWASAEGTQAADGIGMLIEQAAEAFFIWHQVRPDTSLLIQQPRALLHTEDKK